MKTERRSFVEEGVYWGVTLDGIFYPFGGSKQSVDELVGYFKRDESRFKRMFDGEPVELCPLVEEIS